MPVGSKVVQALAWGSRWSCWTAQQNVTTNHTLSPLRCVHYLVSIGNNNEALTVHRKALSLFSPDRHYPTVSQGPPWSIFNIIFVVCRLKFWIRHSARFSRH